jgi:hypothetical protein
VKDCSVAEPQVKSAEPPVTIMKNAGSPMMAGSQGNPNLTNIQGLPPIQLVDPIESQVLYQVANAVRDNDGLKGRDPSKSASVQMIEMSVRDQNEIDRGKMMQW